MTNLSTTKERLYSFTKKEILEILASYIEMKGVCLSGEITLKADTDGNLYVSANGGKK